MSSYRPYVPSPEPTGYMPSDLLATPQTTYSPVAIYPQPGYPMSVDTRPEHPSATTVLVLGILSFVVGLTAPFAWYLGSKAIKECRTTGMYRPSGTLTAGYILGIIGTVLITVFVAMMLLFITIGMIGWMSATR